MLLHLESAAHAELVEIDLGAESAAVGKRLKEIALPDECVIVSIQRGGRVVMPRGNTQLLPGDRVIAMVAPQAREQVEKVLLADNRTAADRQGK